MKISERKELHASLNETPINFSLTIDSMVHEKKISYLEAIAIYCQENDLDEEQVVGLITANLKSKIFAESSKNNLIKKSYRPSALPIEED